MSSTTNTPINSRSMNGVITISDGEAILENGNLNCDDIVSNSLNTSNINTSLLTCTGKFESNLNGPYTIPTSISSLTGLLTSYGNTTNSGATDLQILVRTYTSTQQGLDFVPQPYILGRTIQNRIVGMLGAYIDVEALIG